MAGLGDNEPSAAEAAAEAEEPVVGDGDGDESLFLKSEMMSARIEWGEEELEEGEAVEVALAEAARGAAATVVAESLI